MLAQETPSQNHRNVTAALTGEFSCDTNCLKTRIDDLSVFPKVAYMYVQGIHCRVDVFIHVLLLYFIKFYLTAAL